MKISRETTLSMVKMIVCEQGCFCTEHIHTGSSDEDQRWQRHKNIVSVLNDLGLDKMAVIKLAMELDPSVVVEDKYKHSRAWYWVIQAPYINGPSIQGTHLMTEYIYQAICQLYPDQPEEK